MRASSSSRGEQPSGLSPRQTGGATRKGGFRKFRALPWRDRWLLAEAFPYLAMARFLVLTVPFARLSRWWGLHESEAAVAGGEDVPTEAMQDLARRVGFAVSRVAGRMPWRSTCLAQALAAAAMLRRRQIPATLCLGVRHDTAEGLAAHAWLRVGQTIVTGAGIHQAYGVVGVFSSGESNH